MDAEELCREARLLAHQGRSAEASALVGELLAEHPSHAPALLLQGQLLDEGHQPLAALTCYEQATALAPGSAAAWNARARQLRALGRGDEALSAVSRAREVLALEENFAETGPVYLTLLLCLRDQRRYLEALAAAEEGLARTSDAVLAEWASQVEQELARAQEERC
jgi:tetratricopeptide (TPR) repeat protein